MPITKAIRRRDYLMTAAIFASLGGCLGTRGDRPGVLDASDVSVTSSGSAKVTARNVQEDNDSGLQVSTEDSMTDGEVIVELPISVSKPSLSTIYINADVDELDDDAEVEIQFQAAEYTYRCIYISNEYKTKKNGVLATETGSGFELQKPFEKLPSPNTVQKPQIDALSRTRLVIRDGDFSGKIWTLWFIFEDKTISVL